MGQRFSRDRPSNDPLQPPRWIDFPFLKESDTIAYVGQSKVLFLLRGLPGSGKSFIAEQLHSTYPRASVCSTDDYFSRDGIYHWQPNLLPQAHQSCRDRTFSACRNNRTNVIVVDNTNIRLEEMDPYIRLANDTGYAVVIIESKTPWARDPKQLASHSVHAVPLNVVRNRLGQWEVTMPLYYAWFLNEADAIALDAVAQNYLDECGRNAVFVSNFQKYAPCSGQDLHQFFTNFTVADSNGLLHCTANYCGTEEHPGDRDYAKRKDVAAACGRAYALTVIGFVITPRTFGARVLLDKNALSLWNQDDNEPMPPTPPPCNVEESILSKLEQLSISRPLTPCTATLHWNREDFTGSKDPFRPTQGRGSRAHLTLGCSSKNKAVQTGLDLIDVIQCEQKLGNRHPETSFHVHQGTARCLGEGRWVIYLKKAITVQSIFTGYYLPTE